MFTAIYETRWPVLRLCTVPPRSTVVFVEIVFAVVVVVVGRVSVAIVVVLFCCHTHLKHHEAQHAMRHGVIAAGTTTALLD